MQGSSWEKMGKDEYLTALRERHNLSHKEKPVKININDVVMIKGDEKNRGKWKIGIIENVFMVKDNTIRLIRIFTGKSVIDRPIQLLYLIRSLKVNYQQHSR